MIKLSFSLILFVISWSLAGQNYRSYEIEIVKKLWKIEPIIPDENLDKKRLNDGQLHVHFTSSFELDTISIKVNGKEFGTFILTTEWSTELAEIIRIPDFKQIKNLSISINNGPNGYIEIKRFNQVSVSFWDRVLRIGLRKHVMYYD